MTQKKVATQPVGQYFIRGNYAVLSTVFQTQVVLESPPPRDFPYLSKQTTRGETIEVLEVELRIIEGLQYRRRQGERGLEFTVYQLLSNGLIRPLKEKTLKDESPVRKARKAIREKLPHRWPAMAAKR